MRFDTMVESLFAFLVSEYHLEYIKQDFENCYGGYWSVHTYSFTNASGCFTIYTLPAKDELSFYYSRRVGKNHEELCENFADVYSLEPKVWAKHAKWGKYYKPFFLSSKYRILRAVADIIATHLTHSDELFGMCCKKTGDGSVS